MARLLRRMVESYQKGWKPDRQLQHELDSWRLVTATSWCMHGPDSRALLRSGLLTR